MAETRLWAIVDNGEFEGDSAFYCPNSAVRYTEGMTLKDIKKAYLKKLLKEDPDEDPKEFEEDVKDITIAWIVTDQVKKALANSWPDCGGDSETYTVNWTMKSICSRLAIKTIRTKTK